MLARLHPALAGSDPRRTWADHHRAVVAGVFHILNHAVSSVQPAAITASLSSRCSTCSSPRRWAPPAACGWRCWCWWRRWRARIRCIGLGLLLATFGGMASMLFGVPFLTSGHLDLQLPLIGSVPLASALVFDTGVYLVGHADPVDDGQTRGHDPARPAGAQALVLTAIVIAFAMTAVSNGAGRGGGWACSTARS
ncbi:hypothetical protein NB693_22960 [Pantoea ananatis]|uniref:MnhB domain-containing protein n=1 Tax=Pantoea ananas TaxID=553 RepID=UPI002220C1F1|nr:hypothetical protein [Pantoea ananatis]